MDDSKAHRSSGSVGSAAATSQPNAIAKKKRKRKPRRNPQRKGAAVSSKHGPPLAPSLKVTIRNIFTVDMAQTIQNLISAANENSPTVLSMTAKDLMPKVVLDETSLQQLVDEMKLAEEAAKKWKEEGDSKNAIGVNSVAEKDDNSNAHALSSDKTNEMNDSTSVDNLATVVARSLKITDAESNASKKVGKNQSVLARVLYMVPPKKTRRRGEKPGIAYLLLTAPAIEPKLAPVAELQPVNEEGDLPVDGVTSSAHGDEAKPVDCVLPTVDYSRDVAKGRLLLQNTLELLQVTASNVSTPPMVVEESRNTKVWKQQPFSSRSPVDRLAGTIFETEDYQQFVEGTVRREEQLKARPKPAPGGGVSMTSGGAASNVPGSNAQPVAALVLHLQKKQEEEKKRKLAMRKSKDVKKSKSSNSAGAQKQAALTNGVNGSSVENGRVTNKKKSGNRRVRKKKPSNPNGKQSDNNSKKPNGG
jgi:hypothetical protein